MTRVTDVVRVRAGVPVLECAPEGPPITTMADALDLIALTYQGAEVVALPVTRLDDRFFSLGTGFAGELMQKFVNYRLTLALVGDISEHAATSSALRALVGESNRAGHVWFVADLDVLDARLAVRAS